MSRGITQREFHLLRNLIESVCGVSLGHDKQYLVEAKLSVLVSTCGCSSFEELFLTAVGSGGEGVKEQIIDAIVTSETSWFRDKSVWVALRDHILPKLAAKAAGNPVRTIRCWSAACSTGQEPYSLAMLTDGLFSGNDEPPTTEILASDVSNQSLDAARRGAYDRILMGRGFDGSFEQFRTAYFADSGRTSIIAPAIRDRVRFERLNLIGESVPSGVFDLILLRNVGIYFSDELKRVLYEKIADALAPHGYLVLGTAESPLGYTSRFVPREIDRAICYRPTK